jgi:hypothetical protein
MLQPFYNWVIPFDVIEAWGRAAGFDTLQLLNDNEAPKVAYHVLFTKSSASEASA